jgi:acetoin utilization deacetylase AcuC-like enzyme
MGGKGALGYNLNIPFASGYGDREYRVCLKEIVEKILNQFLPQFIIVGFGTNIHNSDPASHLIVSDAGLLNIYQNILDICEKFCDGKLISVLEGGTPGNLMAKLTTQHVRFLVNKIAGPVDKVKKEELISYADWYGYAKLLKAQFKKFWKL